MKAILIGGLCVALPAAAAGPTLAADLGVARKTMFGCGDPEPSPSGSSSTSPIAAPKPTDETSLSAELKLDPAVFFQKLVDRYRQLHLYRDVVSVIQVTHRDGAESSRVESQINCEVAQGKLSVKTPAAQARKNLGIDLPIKKSQPLQDAQQEYDLWLAPHMALKFTHQPLKQLRAGVDEEFIPTDAEPVTIDNKKMVHVELRSGDGMSENCNAKVDLYVNSDSMLIERIESEQRLPDGASYSTTLQITPETAEGDMPASAPAVSENSPPA